MKRKVILIAILIVSRSVDLRTKKFRAENDKNSYFILGILSILHYASLKINTESAKQILTLKPQFHCLDILYFLS